MGTIGKISADGATHLVASTAYGTCPTAAATVAKVATIQDSQAFTLFTGVTVHIKFTYSNTASSPTLNVNSTGAKAIKRYGTTAASTSAATSWNAGAVISFTYDGTNWVMNDWINTTYSAMSQSEADTGTATTGRLITAKVLNDTINSRLINAFCSYRGGSSSAITIPANTITQVSLGEYAGGNNSTIYTNVNNGIKVAYEGWYNVKASVYAHAVAAVTNIDCFVFQSNNDGAYSSATEVIANYSYTGQTANNNVVQASKIVSAYDSDVFFLAMRARGSTATLYPQNKMTFLQLEYLGYA